MNMNIYDSTVSVIVPQIQNVDNLNDILTMNSKGTFPLNPLSRYHPNCRNFVFVYYKRDSKIINIHIHKNKVLFTNMNQYLNINMLL